MITALVLSLFGLTFAEQEIPDIEVYRDFFNNLTGRVSMNFRQVELDGDGLVDLIVGNKVFFQRAGRFDTDAPAMLPERDAPSEYDTWNKNIYLRFADRLEVVRWLEGGWHTEMQCPLARPEDRAAAPLEGRLDQESGQKEGVRASSARFLYDFDLDGVPEIVEPSPKGLHVFRRQSETYTEVVCLDIFPPPQVSYGTSSLWPQAERHLTLPTRRSDCDFFLEANTATVITREFVSNGKVRYRTSRYTLDPKSNFAVTSEKTEVTVTPAMDAYLKPCRLNGDTGTDFAGFQRDGSDLPGSDTVLRTYASTDGGNTIQVRAARSMNSSQCFVDFDGDGDLDMVTQPTECYEGGIRERAERALTRREVEHEVDVYLQDARGLLSEPPDVRARVTIYFEKTLIHWDDTAQDYARGWRVDMIGDFNGDGYRDLVVQETPSTISVYLCVNRAYSQKPDAVIDLKPCKSANFAVADVNGDGLSDLFVTRIIEDAAIRDTVFFAIREDAE